MLPTDYEETVSAMSEEEIRRRIAELTIARLEWEQQRKSNEELQKAKDVVATLDDPFKSAIKELKEMVACCKKVLDDRGRGVDVG